MRCLLMSFNAIYSSKVILSSLISLCTLTLGLSILLPMTCGGILSLVPPTGEPTRAQEARMMLRSNRKKNLFMKQICAKLRNLFTVTVIRLVLFQRICFAHGFLNFLPFVREILKKSGKCQCGIYATRIFIANCNNRDL